MCGILGVVGDEEKVGRVRDRARESLRALQHRGPDGHDLVQGPRAILGHTRLSIVGLTHGSQPMRSPDGRLTITFNGEIYNYRELAADLERRGHRFSTGSDTEVVLAAYREHGERCVESFHGMFAFAIYDEASGALFAARDRFGIKPFYYAETDGMLAFASETRALYALGAVPFELNPAHLDEFLVFGYVAGPATLHARLKELEPGHLLRREGGAVRIRRYWYPVPERAARPSEAEAVAEVEARLDRAVRLWAPPEPDTPVFSLLSGGVDSSVVTRLLGRCCNRVTAVTAYFPEDPELDERPRARRLAEVAGIRLVEVPIPEGFLLDRFDRLAGRFDEPIHDANAFTVQALCEAVKASDPTTKIVFCGEGSDEIFGGYARHRTIAEEYDRTGDPEILKFARNRVALPRLRMITDRAPRFHPARDEILRGLRSGEAVNRVLEQDQLTFLTAYLHRQDLVGMEYGLEFRTPFLEHDLTDYVNALPSAFKIAGEWHKYILRKVAERHVPESIAWNRSKGQLSMPVARMLERGPLRDRFEEGLRTDGRLAEYYDVRGIRSLLDQHHPAEPGADHGNTLWRLLALDAWLRSW